MPVQAPEDKIGSFYLGAAYDLDGGVRKDDAPIIYDSRDLVTHAVVVGMTGSGKTGLCVGLLEEAALDKVPALIIDPKGDMTNLLLQFPNLLPEDFKQWVNQGDAERKGKTVEEFADTTAKQWSDGLADWAISGERIQRTLDTVNYTVFTPGSDAGIPVNILGSLAAPKLDWATEGEAIRERIGGTVAALMGLAGVKADTVRSREAVLLASIFEHYWRQNQNLTLEQLILSIQTPPVKTVGVFDVDTFYPPKDRFDMAMAFNNLVAAPTFQSWLTGEPLDIQTLMFTPDGKPRHSIFYIAHLSDSERMFFVTLLLENLVTWMRRQSGTTTLSALVYFDEIFGYFPPTAEPPSKRPLLTLMKQARAFGLGVVLVTQNPVDLDYKGLTNAGTWLIGKLQAERDKARVLEGLKGALSEAGAEDKTNYDTLIPKLGSRVFLMHNVNARGPQVFTTRWAQSYLRGPLTKTQVRELMKDRKPQTTFESVTGGPDQVTINPPQPDAAQAAAFASTVATPAAAPIPTPAPISNVPAGLLASAPITERVEQAFLPLALDANQAAAKLNEGSLVPVSPQRTYLVYRPNALGVAVISYQDKKRGVEHREDRVLLATIEDSVGRVDWAAGEALSLKPRDLRRAPEAAGPDGGPYFEPLPESANTATELKKISSDLEDWLYYNARVKVKTQAQLEVTQAPGESDEAFQARVRQAADAGYNAELAKSKEALQKKEMALAEKLKKAQQELVDDQSKANAKRMDQVTSLGEGIFNFFFGRRSSSVVSQAMRKQNQAAAAGAEVEKTKQLIADLTAQQAQLDADTMAQAEAIANRWKEIGTQITLVDVAPRRSDVAVDLLAVGWTPEWVIEYDDNGFTRSRRVPAHTTA